MNAVKKEEEKAKSHELYFILHTHWDREWYLPFQKFRFHLVNLIDNVLNKLENDKEYKYFNLDGQTIVLEDYLEIRPDSKEKLKKHIRSGRLGVGPWYNQPDEWTLGELISRNLLWGAIISEEFGRRQRIGYCPDTFGHVSQMPQILRLADLDNFMFSRGLGDEYDDPNFSNEFYWEGPDGSKVLTYYMPGGYSNAKNHPLEQELFNSFILFAFGRLAKSKTHVYFLGCGGDHYFPQVNTTELIKGFNSDPEILEELEGGKLILASLEDFFARIKGREDPNDPFLTIKGELRGGRTDMFLPGTISSRIYLKQENSDKLRKLCYLVEPIDLIWGELTNERDGNFIKLSWKYLLQNQPHDSICGCSIDPVHRHMEHRFANCGQISEEFIHEQMLKIYMGQTYWEQQLLKEYEKKEPKKYQALMERRKNEIKFIVFKPYFSRSKDSPIILKIYLSKSPHFYEPNIIHVPDLDFTKKYVVFKASDDSNSDDNNNDNNNDKNLLSFKTVQRKTIYKNDIEMLEITWVEDTDSLENVSLDIAGIGHTTYYLRNILPENSEDNPMDNGKIKNNEEEIINKKYETKWATIQINENGSFDLIFKSTGKEFKNLHYFIDCADAGDGYDFYMPKNDSEINNLDLKAEIQAEENELSYIFKVDYTFPLPEALNKERTERLEKKIGLKIHSTITIWKEFSRIDFNTELFNNVRDHRLRVAFPTPIRTDHVNASSVYDVVERGIGIEEYINTMSKWSQKPEPTSFMNGFVDISDDYGDHNPKEGENKRTSMAVFSKGLNEYEARRIKDGAMGQGQERESNNNHSENTEKGSAVEMILTLLRAVRYEGGYIPTRGHAGDPIPTPDAQLQRQLKFEYALYFHENDWEEDLIPLKSQEYILPISIIGGQVKIPGRRNVQEFPEYKKYKLPPHSNYLYIPNPNLILTAFKKGERPENGDYFVLRLYNPTRKEQESIIELNADLLRGVKRIGLLNLIEKEIPNNGELMVKKQEETIESIKVTIKPKKIITLGFFK